MYMCVVDMSKRDMNGSQSLFQTEEMAPKPGFIL